MPPPPVRKNTAPGNGGSSFQTVDMDIFAFSLICSKQADEIATPVSIGCRPELCERCDQPVHQCTAIWDTGATSSMIARHVSEKLGLQTIGQVRIAGIHGAQAANVYEVDLIFGNGMRIPKVKVSEASDGGGFDVLIGMDIIRRGVFIVDGSAGETSVYFACPAISN